ncbi:hypothetical protein B0H15DRAFT_953977 [Mycena belliarum]|uniref:Uncharacterized protein n=1 Tax=Mycena belliarum TaxID=1033014 RepID=A0AAD6XPY3_9AGAR|nr:hypothetical protein B0H15DRAFT_953977 [Mycena belliae]
MALQIEQKDALDFQVLTISASRRHCDCDPTLPLTAPTVHQQRKGSAVDPRAAFAHLRPTPTASARGLRHDFGSRDQVPGSTELIEGGGGGAELHSRQIDASERGATYRGCTRRDRERAGEEGRSGGDRLRCYTRTRTDPEGHNTETTHKLNMSVQYRSIGSRRLSRSLIPASTQRLFGRNGLQIATPFLGKTPARSALCRAETPQTHDGAFKGRPRAVRLIRASCASPAARLSADNSLQTPPSAAPRQTGCSAQLRCITRA